MQIHTIKRNHKLKTKKRIGRGGKRGTYSGKGQKGQKSRAGKRFKPAVRDLIKRYPKLRGYQNNPVDKKEFSIINLETLENNFNKGDKVNPHILIEKNVIEKKKGRIPNIKILGKGELTKELTIENCYISKSAEEKIKKSQGIIKQIKKGIKNQKKEKKDRKEN